MFLRILKIFTIFCSKNNFLFNQVLSKYFFLLQKSILNAFKVLKPHFSTAVSHSAFGAFPIARGVSMLQRTPALWRAACKTNLFIFTLIFAILITRIKIMMLRSSFLFLKYLIIYIPITDQIDIFKFYIEFSWDVFFQINNSKRKWKTHKIEKMIFLKPIYFSIRTFKSRIWLKLAKFKSNFQNLKPILSVNCLKMWKFSPLSIRQHFCLPLLVWWHSRGSRCGPWPSDSHCNESGSPSTNRTRT